MKNTTIQFVSPILMAIILGLLCNSIWLYEILQIKSWHSLNWLNGYMNSIFFIIPLTVCSYVLSLRAIRKISLKRVLFAIVGLSIISIISYEIARRVLFDIYLDVFGLNYSRMEVFIGIITPNLIYSLGFYYLTNKLLIKIAKWTIFLFLTTIVLSVVFGIVTININSGFGLGKTFIDSVKMGYPIFWLNVFLGINAIVMLKINRNYQGIISSKSNTSAHLPAGR